MKYLQTLTILALIAFVPISSVRAELLTNLYGVNISDANPYKDGNNLFQLFNNYFELDETTGYSSSNALFNDRGVDPYAVWTTSGSELIGAFKVAAFGHELTVTDGAGNNLGSIVDYSGTSDIHTPGGISNLGDSSLALPDGVRVNFQLDATLWGQDAFSWSSDPTANAGDQPRNQIGDDMIHMVAFDITDIYNSFFNTDYESVFMMGWEDMHLTGGGYSPADWDYQDFVAIITNLRPETTSNVPEPATWMMFLAGGIGLAWRQRRNKK